MKFLLLTDLRHKHTRKGQLFNNCRSSGALHIVQVAKEEGVESTGIDYWRNWPEDLLNESILTWFNNDPDPWIALSGSIDASSTQKFKELVEELKKEIPQLKVMLGGYRTCVGEKDWVDIAFIGRSTNLFKKWIRNEPLEPFIFSNDPLTYKNPYKIILEEPVNPIVDASDFISSREVLVIETALGCKFDCNFCGYDYRNNKNPAMVTEERLYNSLKTAHDLFGTTHFFLADDTINEIDDKLKLIGKVREQLDFDPTFMAFVRLDVMGAHTHQIELIKKAGIDAVFFGIESFNPEVTKLIRKGGKPEGLLDTLRLFKKELPNTFTYANFIIGLTGDSEESIWKHADILIDEQLVTSAGCGPLRIYKNVGNPDIESNIDKEPEKFGYNLFEYDSSDSFRGAEILGYSSKAWTNDWTDIIEAEQISIEYDKKMADSLESPFSSHEVFCLSGMFEDRLPWGNYNRLLPIANKGQAKMLNKYILNKSDWMKSDK